MKDWQQIGDVARNVVNRLAEARTRRAIGNLVMYLEREERCNREKYSFRRGGDDESPSY